MRVTDATRSLGLVVSGARHHARCMSTADSEATCMTPCMPSNACVLPQSMQVCRGTAVMLVAPTLGMEQIANPFINQEEGGE